MTLVCIYSMSMITKREDRKTMTRQTGKGEDMESMNMKEVTRLILDLRAAGWSDTEIINHILYIETGEGKYKTKKKETTD